MLDSVVIAPPPALPAAEVRRVVEQALAEDLPWGDVTSDTLVPAETRGRGAIVARAAGVLAGLPVAQAVFAAVDPGLDFAPLASDGAQLHPGQRVATVAGSARSILRGERAALNFLQRLSGVATLTAKYVAAVEGTGARIVDTRKTTPGLRSLEKYAVRMGGGFNHRRCLSDGVLVKDNHLVALQARGVSLREALRAARRAIPHTLALEVEVDRLDQIEEALAGGADAILLDNMPPETLRQAVQIINRRAITEASGGVTLATVRAIAESGVDLISVGALTHSAPALDLALDLEVEP